jgi:DNA replication protein DnaC
MKCKNNAVCAKCGERLIEGCASGFIETEDRRIYGCPGLYRRGLSERMDAFLPRENRPRFEDAKIADARVETWMRAGAKNSLILIGPNGTAKTTHASALIRQLRFEGKSARLINVIELLAAFKATFDDHSGESITQDEIIEYCCKLDYLGFDDLGQEKLTDWAEEILIHTVNTAYENECKFIITTNLTPQSFKGTTRFAAMLSRLADGATIIPLTKVYRAQPKIMHEHVPVAASKGDGI